MQIRDALHLYLGQLHADGRSIHTRDQYARHVGSLAAWLASQGHSGRVGDVTHQDLARFLAAPEAALRADGRAKRPSSLNTTRSSLRTFWSYCHQVGLVGSNPARLIRRARCGEPPPRSLSDGEVDRLLAAVGDCPTPEGRRDLALFRVMLEAGLRLSSALALDVEDLDLDQREIHARAVKGARSDVVLMPTALADHLRGYLSDGWTGPLFQGRDGRRLSPRHVQRRLALWLGLAGVQRRASPHSLRHTFAQRLYRSTGDLLLVREALGHRSITSTLTYARADAARLRRALA